VIEEDTVIVDVGGGSTELVLGGPDGVSFHTSLDLGCVRMTERFGDDVDACSVHVRSALPDLEPGTAIGVAGTVTSLAALDLGLVEYDAERVHGHVLSRGAVEEQLERLAWLPLEERRRVPGLEPERAPVIVAGAVIVREVLKRYGLDALEASEHDILHGAALAAAELPAAEEGAAPPGAYTCC
jgi:exopolyphosphatase/guanosine-5'-triphosphate,3'-diphosphate pyrophosphatase